MPAKVKDPNKVAQVIADDLATPRPWILVSPKDAVYGYTVAVATGLHTDPETIANAELIVRAVNAHDALVALARAIALPVIQADGSCGPTPFGELQRKAHAALKLVGE